MFPELPALKHLAPARRFRGQRRYFRRICRKAKEFDPETLGLTGWNFWHDHADWPGWGNRGWAWRRPHVEALAIRDCTIASRKNDFPVPFQSWITLACHDAGQDAVWLTTADSSEHSFPYCPRFTETRFPRLERELAPMFRGLRIKARELVWTPSEEPSTQPVSTIYLWSDAVGAPLIAEA
jgi:hypothetical protein